MTADALRHRARTALAAFGCTLLAACASTAPAPDGGRASPAAPGTAPVTTGASFMVAAAHPLAAEAGRSILAAGGSAVDAAIAMQMVLTLVEPQSSGIGGGAFMLHWDGKRVQSFDGRETAPADVDQNLFLRADSRPIPFMDAAVGGRAVGVPGVVRMLEVAHQQHGRLPWARLFEPAIALAERGFALSARLHALLAADPYLRQDPAARALFYAEDGTVKPVGATLRNPALAETLRAIAKGGARGFYWGPVALDVVTAVRNHPRNPGAMRLADVVYYRAVERPPVCTDYKSWRVCGMGPPSSGGILVAQMLGILAVRNIAVVPPVLIRGELQPQPDAVHLFSEAARLAYADRDVYVADSDFVPVNVAALTAPDYLAQRARQIGPRSMGSASAGRPAGMAAGVGRDHSPARSATSHLSVVDARGNAVSMTSSIEGTFGSRIVVRGFLLNSQLTDFSFRPTDERGVPVANRVQPGKRPRSTMAPTLVFDRASGQLVASLGSPGGTQIANYVADTLVGLLDWRLDLGAAIALPHFGSRNGATEVEAGRIAPEVIDGLRARGHDVQAVVMHSGLQGIVRLPRPDGRAVWAGAADPRGEGVALGQ